MSANPNAARRLVEALVANGVDHVFCVPGESYLAVLDALADVEDRVRVVACRHEAGAANMAEAYGKLTGRPGICMVTRGPGATHASVGVHTAHQDSTPMILFVGQVAAADKGRGAFQEVDYHAAFGPLSKWAAELDEPGRTAEIVGRAFATATQGRQGPVVLALPEDKLHEDGGPAPVRPVAPARAGLDPAVLETIEQRLKEAEAPLVVLGGSGWTRPALAALSDWLKAHDLPMVLSFRRKDLIDNDHPCYVGDLGLGPNPKLVERVKSADLILAIGARLGENPTQGYSLLTPEFTAQRLIHIHPGPEELGRVWPASAAGVADVSPAALAVASIGGDRKWTAWREAARADYEAFTAPIDVPAAVNLSEVVAHMAEVLPKDAIICNGAGNFAAWLHRFIRHRSFRTQLAPTSGAMGYGFPAAIAAKLVHPERDVVCFAGDGDFMMTSQELATAVQYGANVITVVVDNGTYGTIRMHQEREYPGRVIATDLQNPDFAAYARSFGAWAETVDRGEDFPAAFAAARAAGKPALIHLKTDPEQIAPGRTITQLRGGRA
ncbi:thiamine pyrophosphate-binding protein [Caulobacter sp. 17J80-11]|uniref:thiamine pyrophosphate-binding protein n=1 Tax=Caulobacter sp. 17J80-11 TaxID=2763502 RepID=UPI0016539C55|nr:thiamine pyrophosphate-binding protein [Caulobacter sp. 17J80-11]MBC6983589.1 thiamine pyrophosphate-binding protein [Caulobacter sp. 17J80-11]